ncbi:MAG: hypothetical protein ACTSPV_00360 [Candidatus Hodarchaeales archaeon]
MATVKLGLSGSEITLPAIKWLEGNKPELPTSIHKQISEAKMSDGSSRWGFYSASEKRTFIWEHGFLTKAELDQIKTLRGYNQILRYQNNNEDATWYDVVFISFEYGPVRTDVLNLGRYWCRIVLREA